MRTTLAKWTPLILVSALVLALALVFVLPAFAAVTVHVAAGVVEDCSTVVAQAQAIPDNGEAVQAYIELHRGNTVLTNSQSNVGVTVQVASQLDGAPDTGCSAIARVFVNGELVACQAAGAAECPVEGGGDAAPEPPAGIWSADVCEPFDGFSGDGWATFGSDANEKPYGSTLYVAASADGPWYETGFLQSPYVISQSQMDALTAMVGLTDYHAMWMKAGAEGSPANVGSMIADRAAHMDALCGN